MTQTEFFRATSGFYSRIYMQPSQKKLPARRIGKYFYFIIMNTNRTNRGQLECKYNDEQFSNSSITEWWLEITYGNVISKCIGSLWASKWTQLSMLSILCDWRDTVHNVFIHFTSLSRITVIGTNLSYLYGEGARFFITKSQRRVRWKGDQYMNVKY